jgi:hypothetical protein
VSLIRVYQTNDGFGSPCWVILGDLLGQTTPAHTALLTPPFSAFGNSAISLTGSRTARDRELKWSSQRLGLRTNGVKSDVTGIDLATLASPPIRRP